MQTYFAAWLLSSEMDRTRSRRHDESIITYALLEAVEASRVCRGWSSVLLHTCSATNIYMSSVAHRINSCAVRRTWVAAEARHAHHILRRQHRRLQDPYNHCWHRHAEGQRRSDLRDFSRDMFFPAVQFFIIYSHIGVTMTLLIVSDIHNHSTNARLVLLDFATVSYHIA